MANELLVLLMLIIVIITIAFLVSSVTIIQPYEQGIVIVSGKFQRIIGPGFQMVFPIISKVIRIDLRVQTLEIPMQELRTSTGKDFDKNVIVYFKVVDPEKAYFGVENYRNELRSIAQKIISSEISTLK